MPLFMDSATTSLSRPSVAHVCVEIDLLKPLLKRVWVGVVTNKAEGFWQTLKAEGLPAYCNFCFCQGHSEDGCHLKYPELRVSHGTVGRAEKGQQEGTQAVVKASSVQ